MPSAAISYEPAQRLESARMLYDLIRSPADYEVWIERYSSGLLFRLGFGKTLSHGGENTYLDRVSRTVHVFQRVATMGNYLVDFFPSMMWIPKFLAPFKRELEQSHLDERTLFRELLDDIKDQMDKGRAPECWERTVIEKHKEFGLTLDQGAYIVGNVFEAGSGPSTDALLWLMRALVVYPDWLKAVQEEVDRTVGDTRLPDFHDVPKLPTVRAVVKETMRLRPPVGAGIPHQLVKDDVYDGLFFPAGTVVHANQW
ncbi:putative cytochrome p450 [Diaporthe ampelina]|uniref:Putative cytochrome p450 n=1 Tax=Diaporthe ampelina TaxID=1214573 RepID=A0A0G2HY65_9PEZI|nr:putative cytochrome p450 [Diaporthe ampelina]